MEEAGGADENDTRFCLVLLAAVVCLAMTRGRRRCRSARLLCRSLGLLFTERYRQRQLQLLLLRLHVSISVAHPAPHALALSSLLALLALLGVTGGGAAVCSEAAMARATSSSSEPGCAMSQTRHHMQGRTGPVAAAASVVALRAG